MTMNEAVILKFSITPRKFFGAVLSPVFFYFAFLAAAVLFCMPAGSFAAADETATKGEADTLGLIIKSIEMVEDKPLLVSIYNVKTGKTIEYTAGDYVSGKLIRDILEDRVVLLDEVTKYQYVLIFNDTVSEEEEDAAVPLIRVREKKREIDGMDITYEFNKSINKLAGKDIKYGAGTPEDEEAERNKMKQTTKGFSEGKPLSEMPISQATREVETAPKPNTETTSETKISPKASQSAAGPEKATVEVKVSPKSAAKESKPAEPAASDKTSSSTAEVKTSPASTSGAKTMTTKDGKTTVKIR